MAVHTFKVTVVGGDKLWTVKFHPEMDDDLEIIWDRRNGFTRYISEPFSLEVTGDFDFELIVGAQNTISYTYTIEIQEEKERWKKIDSDTRTIKKKNKDKFQKSISLPAPIAPVISLIA